MKTKIPWSAILSLALVASCSKDESEPAAGGAAPSPTSAAAENYPLTTCVVSGEELGGMGEPVDYDHNGTLVKFCCKNCIPKFQADPETYLRKLQ